MPRSCYSFCHLENPFTEKEMKIRFNENFS